jgi:type I restriction enzyme, S subunit
MNDLHMLPAGWHWANFGKIARVASNLVDPMSYLDFPHIAPNHIQSNTGMLLPFTTIAEDGVTSPKHLFRAGQILYSKIRPYLAKATIPTFDGLCSADMYPIETSLNPSYLLYWLLSPEFTQYASRVQGRTVLPKINRNQLEQLPVPVPPIQEQAGIVAAIEEHLSRLEAASASIARAGRNLKAFRSSILLAAMSGDLVGKIPGEGDGMGLIAQITKERQAKRPPAIASSSIKVPEYWGVTSLEALTDPGRVICYGILKPKVREGGSVPYVEVKDLRSGALDVATLHRTSPELHLEFARSELKVGDIVLAIRGSYDRALVVPPSVAGANISRDVARIAPLPGIEPTFLAAYLTSPPALGYLQNRARGVAVKGVNISDLRNMPVPVPPHAEQRRIVGELDRINSVTSDLEASLSSARVRAGNARAAILKAAFSGRLT